MAPEQRNQRVAVVGGGIIGLSVAVACARAGAAVELFERGDTAGEATRVAAGMLAPVAENDLAEPELLALGLESIALWPEFAAMLEEESDGRPVHVLPAPADGPSGDAERARNAARRAADETESAQLDAEGGVPLLGMGGTHAEGCVPLLGPGGADAEGRVPLLGPGGADAEGNVPLLGTDGTHAEGNVPLLGTDGTHAEGRVPLLRTDGTLLVARDADEGRWLDREAALLDEAGLDYERLTPSQARKLEPDLAPGLRGALRVPGDLSVDPRAVAAALLRALGRIGVPVHERSELDGLDDPRLADFDRVVVCTGAWPIPGIEPVAATHPVKGQLLMLRDPDHDGRDEPIVQRTLRGYNVYVVPRGDGRYAVGATMEHRGYDRTVTAWAVHDLLRELFEVVPAAREFVIEESLAGLRPATASGDPLIGPSPADPAGDEARVLYAVGHYRNGVLLAPATARRIAKLIAG